MAVPAGAGWQAIALRGGEEAGLWPSFAVDFLSACHEFKPLEEHVRAYARYHSLGSDQVREIVHWAGEMINAGLLAGLSRLVERCVAAGSPGSAEEEEGESGGRRAGGRILPNGLQAAAEPAHINAIGIPTSGNEERLRRVITTFARNALQYGRRIEITLSANGPLGNAPATAAWIASLARAESVKITLLDDAERERYGARLAQRAGVDPAIAAFALGDPYGAGFACGANRNALLLLHAGRPYLSLDDDMVCEMAGAPEPVDQEGLLIFSSRDAFERWFYPRYADAFEGRGTAGGDYLALHEQMLGRSVSTFLAREPKLDFIGSSDGLFRRLQETDGRIVATFTGHYGHPGVPTSYYYLSYRRETLARLAGAGEAEYRAFLASGGVCALVPRMAIADASLSPGMAIGIDARTLIPPFPPVMHAEDFAWGAVLWGCCGSGFAGHLPVALRHDPGLGRGIVAPPLAGARPVAMWEFAHILRGFVTHWRPPPGEMETAARMESLGRLLCDIGGAPAGEFHECLRSFVLQHESDKIDFLEDCLSEEEDAPAYWRRDVEDYIEQTRLALTAPDFDIPFDMREKWPAQDARSLIRRLILEYGRLLQAWPALVEAARAEAG